MTAPLVQLRHGYATDYAGFRLSVETSPVGWTAEVRNPLDRRVVYTAQRYNLEAAKRVIIEFASLWSTGGAPIRPLAWQEYW